MTTTTEQRIPGSPGFAVQKFWGGEATKLLDEAVQKGSDTKLETAERMTTSPPRSCRRTARERGRKDGEVSTQPGVPDRS